MTRPLDPTSPFAQMDAIRRGSRIGVRPDGAVTHTGSEAAGVTTHRLFSQVRRLLGVSLDHQSSATVVVGPTRRARSLSVVPTFADRSPEADKGGNEGGSDMAMMPTGQRRGRYLSVVPTL